MKMLLLDLSHIHTTHNHIPPTRVTMLSCHCLNESSYCGRKWWAGNNAFNAFIIISIASVH